MSRRVWWVPILTSAILVLQPLGQMTPAQATFPGSNGLIAYAVGYVDGPYFCIEFSDNSGFCSLNASDLAWSPDGTVLAVGAQAGEGAPNRFNPFAIYTMKPDGASTRLIAGRGNSRFPAWSPSGKRIVFTRGWTKTGSNLFIKNLTTGTLTQFTLSPSGVANSSPDWSPDGTEIVFSRRVGSNWDLYMKRLSDGHLTRLTANSLPQIDPSWSPDGKKILYSENGTLHILTLAGRHFQTLVPGWDGVWSPDGTSVAYVGISSDPDCPGAAALFTLALGGTPSQLFCVDGIIARPTWQSQ